MYISLYIHKLLLLLPSRSERVVFAQFLLRLVVKSNELSFSLAANPCLNVGDLAFMMYSNPSQIFKCIAGPSWLSKVL